MKNPNIKIGDLVKLDGLEKPGEGVLKVELGKDGGKPANVDQLGDGMSDFAGTIEDNKDVQVDDVVRLADAMKNAMKRELLPEKAAELLEILKKRFESKEKPYRSAEGVEWNDVQNKLEANPEKLWSLSEMEKTGGEPDVLGQDQKTGEYIFMDCSAESPEGRRNCVYDREGEESLKRDNPGETYNGNAISMAALMGIDVLDERQYRGLQTKGEFDEKSFSWLKTPLNKRQSGVALCGRRAQDDVYVFGSVPDIHFENGAFRGVLRV